MLDVSLNCRMKFALVLKANPEGTKHPGTTSDLILHFYDAKRGEAGFGNINEAINYIAKCKRFDPMVLTIPSQRRYAGYFKNVLDGVKPSQPPLLLKRIIMSEAPRVRKLSFVYLNQKFLRPLNCRSTSLQRHLQRKY